MAHTNSTPYYSLPQFLATDKPAWLVDVNPAYTAIDTGMHAAQTAADAAQTDATQALDDAAAAAGTATTADTKASGAIASIAENFDATSTYTAGEYVIYNNLLYVCTADISTPGPWTGSANWNRATVDSIATAIQNQINTIDAKTGDDIPVSASDPSSIGTNIANLNNAVDGMFKVVNFETTGATSVSAGQTVYLAAADYGYSVPAGYRLAATLSVRLNNDQFAMRYFNPDTYVIAKNLSNSTQSVGVAITVLFAKNDLFA